MPPPPRHRRAATTRQIPADRFKGIPVFNATLGRAALHREVRYHAGRDHRADADRQGALYHLLVPVPGQPGLLQPDALPPANRPEHLRACSAATRPVPAPAARGTRSTTRTWPAPRIPRERSRWPTPDRTRTAASSSSPGRTPRSRRLYTPFGTVIGGMNVLQKIAAAGDDQQNGPGDGYPNLYTAFLYVQVIPQR